MASKTIKEIGVGGIALTNQGPVVITAIEPSPILQVCYGRAVAVRYRSVAGGEESEALLGDETEVEVPADAI